MPKTSALTKAEKARETAAAALEASQRRVGELGRQAQATGPMVGRNRILEEQLKEQNRQGALVAELQRAEKMIRDLTAAGVR